MPAQPPPPPKQAWVRRYEQEDMLASAFRVALASLGPWGAIVSEFATQFVPQQRIDRLQQFVEELSERLAGLEETFQNRVNSSPSFASLFEESSLAAVRTASGERRRDLAALLRTGLNRSDADLIDQQEMLHLLEGLNDPQVLILMSYGSFGDNPSNPDRQKFIEKHPSVFFEPPTSDGSSEERRRWAMYKHYLDELTTRGLLEDVEGVAKSRIKPSLRITRLGRMLLEAIERSESH